MNGAPAVEQHALRGQLADAHLRALDVGEQRDRLRLRSRRRGAQPRSAAACAAPSACERLSRKQSAPARIKRAIWLDRGRSRPERGDDLGVLERSHGRAYRIARELGDHAAWSSLAAKRALRDRDAVRRLDWRGAGGRRVAGRSLIGTMLRVPTPSSISSTAASSSQAAMSSSATLPCAARGSSGGTKPGPGSVWPGRSVVAGGYGPVARRSISACDDDRIAGHRRDSARAPYAVEFVQHALRAHVVGLQRQARFEPRPRVAARDAARDLIVELGRARAVGRRAFVALARRARARAARPASRTSAARPAAS